MIVVVSYISKVNYPNLLSLIVADVPIFVAPLNRSCNVWAYWYHSMWMLSFDHSIQLAVLVMLNGSKELERRETCRN